MRAIVLIVLALHAAASGAQGKIGVEIEETAQDAIGARLVFEIKEALRRSAAFSLEEQSSRAQFGLNLVTLDPDQPGGQRTIYSVAIFWKPANEKGPPRFVQHVVGVCGASKPAECASNVLASFDREITPIVRQLKAGKIR